MKRQQSDAASTDLKQHLEVYHCCARSCSCVCYMLHNDCTHCSGCSLLLSAFASMVDCWEHAMTLDYHASVGRDKTSGSMMSHGRRAKLIRCCVLLSQLLLHCVLQVS